ncbi:c2h2 finger domain-containing protein [Zalerion maritima]|uniref:C2h2 finger domain-containing protein n=1 Tax=Zalerion maritima TaxID=339359 RepID=A0AAD5WUA1_9PEZI|nr:c2h2 finger domain-containing protein [Zalerion maritima]
MTSVLAPQPTNISTHSTDRPDANMSSAPDSVSPTTVKHDEDGERGRRRSRSDDGDSIHNGINPADGNHHNSSNSDGGPARKRRRSRKGLDKKFECTHEGCGKSYSRAEHLYRHQLNHSRKMLYTCDWYDCNREFVRLDLCNRHKERHRTKGSALNRKDANHLSQMDRLGPAGSMSPEAIRPGTNYSKTSGGPMQYQSPKDHSQSPYTPVTNTPPTGFPNGGGVNGQNGSMMGFGGMPGGQRVPHQSPTGPPRPIQTNVGGQYGVMSPTVSTPGGYHPQSATTPQAGPGYVPQSGFAPLSLPPAQYGQTASAMPSREMGPATTGEYEQNQRNDMVLLDQMAMPTTIPVFGSDSFSNKSPYVGIPEDFVAYLFNTQTADNSPITHAVTSSGYNYSEVNNTWNIPYLGADGIGMGYFPQAPPAQVMSVTNLLDQNLPESIISEEKSREVFDLMSQRFHENGHAPVERQRDNIVEGDRSDDSHMLSRKMMQAYIGSYWLHFSDQVPILHQPTFSPDKTPNLLLIAMMTIGAACLDKTHGKDVTKAGAKLSNFLAWHLRWEIFQDVNFRPPAKLWIFQTLLLLELYEKMYSTRELHERAHIHHATTITLMRRGRSLIGKSALETPPGHKDQNGSRQSSCVSHTPDEWWNHWITNEATRRAAFVAFIIDSIHATMFGHSTVMVAHEMRLPLPCDENLWKAPNGAEVARLEANMSSNGIKPISFLEGLKRTLSNQEVKTNSFGRTILMAGLLSVSWHMNQRDLQINSLGGGVSQALGGRDKWRSTLTRAFDLWKGDFDKNLQRLGHLSIYDSKHSEGNVVFESRTVLHHLAHMAMHVDIVDCQIFARAKRLLGRAIGNQDLNSAQRRMKDQWAPSAKARDATYYALKFLYSVLIDDQGPEHPTELPYSARDDVLLNRPWVLYFAVLVVWSYGFALEGPCPNAQIPVSPQDRLQQMREYLRKYGEVSSPEELKHMKGLNHNSPLLMVLKDSFHNARWELLYEGATLLNNCITLNSGQSVK